MKRVIAMVLTLGLAFTLFLFPVSAVAITPNHKVTQHYSNGSLYVTTTATELYPTLTTSLYGGPTVETVVTLRLYNSSNQDLKLDSCVITLSLDSNYIAPFVAGFDNYSNDLYIGDGASTGLLTVLPSADYSYYTGIVIPPHASLYLVASVYLLGKFDTSNQSIIVPNLTSVTTAVTGVATGNYDYPGDPDPVDLSPVIDALDEIGDNTALLQDIKDQLTWSGTYTRYLAGPDPVSIIHADISDGLEYCYTSITVYSGKFFAITSDFEIANQSDLFREGSYVVPIIISLQFENYYDSAVASQETHTLTISDLLPRNSTITYVPGSFTSDVFNIPRIIQSTGSIYAQLLFDFKMGYHEDNSSAVGYQGIIPKGMNFSTFVIYGVVNTPNSFITINSNFTNPSLNLHLSGLNIDSDPRIPLGQMNDALQDISNSLGSGNYSGTISDSQSLQQSEAQIHQQEAQWYADNQTAIEATGIGNYQYNNGFISAFGIARQQIALLWNALGDWTYVYYLVFLLGLATYILRHEPTMKAKQARAAAAQAQKERTEYYRSHKK